MADKFLKQARGRLQEVVPIATSAGAGDADKIVKTDAAGKFDISFMPTGVIADATTMTASELIAAGALINVFDSGGGVFRVRNADASTTGKEAMGFVLAGIANGASGTVFFEGENTGVTALTPGPLYLSDSTPGAVTATPPTTAGHVVQRVGHAYTASAMQFHPNLPIVLA
jgi:hypothetical protein